MEPAFRPRSEFRSGMEIAGVAADVQRPPVYNAEDYAGTLRKYCKMPGLQLYLHNSSSSDNNNVKSAKSRLLGKRADKSDAAQGLFDKHQMEMGLKQFTSISELLNKLKIDLHLSYHSFLKEFISEPNDGVTLLLDLLKVIQLSQTNISGGGGGVNQNTNNNNHNNQHGQEPRLHQSVFKECVYIMPHFLILFISPPYKAKQQQPPLPTDCNKSLYFNPKSF